MLIFRFGLILPDKQKPLTFQATRNVFGDDSDSEDEKKRKPFLLRPSDIIKRQVRILKNLT